jgi:hypothetical protein
MEETQQYPRYQQRPWVAKFESGEYARSWNSYGPGLLASPYQQLFGDESEFDRCTGFFYGIGDVEWWVSAELEGLSPVQADRLLGILERNDAYNKHIHTDERTARVAAYFKLDPAVLRKRNAADYVAAAFRHSVMSLDLDEELVAFVEHYGVYELIDNIPLRPSAAEIMSARRIAPPPNRTFTYWHLDMQGRRTSTSFDATHDPVEAAYSLFQLMDFCGAFVDLNDYHIKNLEDTMVDEHKENGQTAEYARLCASYDRQRAFRSLYQQAKDGSKAMAYRLIIDRAAGRDVGDQRWFADVTALPPDEIDHVLNKYKQDAGH